MASDPMRHGPGNPPGQRRYPLCLGLGRFRGLLNRPRFISRLVDRPAIDCIHMQVQIIMYLYLFHIGRLARIASASAGRHCAFSTCHPSDTPPHA
jgi:hypothetical protein